MSLEDIREFNERTGLPATAAREELERYGARYLRTDSFDHKGVLLRLEQMQYQAPSGNMYMWKRIVPDSPAPSTTPFEIHLEITKTGSRIYKTSSLEEQKKAI